MENVISKTQSVSEVSQSFYFTTTMCNLIYGYCGKRRIVSPDGTSFIIAGLGMNYIISHSPHTFSYNSGELGPLRVINLQRPVPCHGYAC